MTNIQLFVKDQLVDISADTVIRINLKAHELADLSTVWVNYTNTFYAPLTSRNDQIFGFARDARTTSSLPYEATEVKLIQNGIELISNGTIAITVIKDRYELSIYEQLDGFYSRITDKYISEVQLPSLVGIFDNTYINAQRNSRSNVCCPVIDYGNTAVTPIDIKAPLYLPSFSYKTIIEAILTDAGYPSGQRTLDFFDPDDTYGRLALPFGRDKWEYSQRYLDKANFYAYTGAQSIPFGAGFVTTKVSFTDVKSGNNQLGWYDGIRQWNIPAYGYFYVKTVGYRLKFTVTGMVGGDALFLELFLGTISNTLAIPGNGTYIKNLDISVPVAAAGTSLYVDFAKTGAGTGVVVTIESGEFHGLLDTQIPSVPDATVYFPALLPDVKQTDLVKDFITRYFLTSYEKNSVINFRSFDKIIRDEGNAIDWTAKRAAEIIDWEYFKGLNYGQVNRFNFADQTYGGGQFLITNEALDDSVDIIVSSFNSLPTSFLDGLYVAKVAIYDSTSTLVTDFKGKPGATLVLLRDRSTADPTVKYNGTTRTDYQVAEFASEIGWNHFIDLNATQLVGALQQMKLIFRYYYLTDADIQQFSFHRLVFDKDTLYLVNSVDDYIPQKPTRLQLLKL